jgi:hypothetical protein
MSKERGGSKYLACTARNKRVLAAPIIIVSLFFVFQQHPSSEDPWEICEAVDAAETQPSHAMPLLVDECMLPT